MHFGVRAIAGGSVNRLRLWLLVTLALGILFLLGQVYDYTTSLASESPTACSARSSTP